MKILLAEALPTRGHRVLLIHTYEILSKQHDVTTIIPQEEIKDGINAIINPYGYFSKKGNKINEWMCFLQYSKRIIKQISREFNNNDYDCLILLTYEEITLYLFNKYLKKQNKIFIMQHVNVDIASRSKIRRFALKKNLNRFNNIVQCGFIYEYLRKNYKTTNTIVWPHPLNIMDSKGIQEIQERKFVGLSYSNDESYIEKIIDHEKETSFFENNNIKLILKSQKNSFDNGYLKVVKGYISNEDYDQWINTSIGLVMLFPYSFKYRMSGTLMDALSNNKVLLSTGIKLIEAASPNYRNLIHIITIDSLYQELLTIVGKRLSADEFKSFEFNHCDEHLCELYTSGLNDVINGNKHSALYDF